MRLSDLLDEDGLKQDEWSLTAPTFGKEEQLTVVGWNGKQGANKLYILKCHVCSQDSELFEEGYFYSLKYNLVNGQVCCGCAFNPKWSKEQYTVICSRKAKELGYTFIGFADQWKGSHSKIRMLCEKHGEWMSGNITDLVSGQKGCPLCGDEATREALTKPSNLMIQSFHESGGFHPETEFWKIDRLTKSGCNGRWRVSCPECGEVGDSLAGNLQKGFRPCACSMHRQRECYINSLIDDHNMVAIKFGIANNSKRRAVS